MTFKLQMITDTCPREDIPYNIVCPVFAAVPVKHDG